MEFKSSLFLNKNSAELHLQTWVCCAQSNNTFKTFPVPLLLSQVLSHSGIMAFAPLVRCPEKKPALTLIKAGTPHSAPSSWHWSVLEALWALMAEAQILETTSRLVPRQTGNCSIPANCSLVWREFNAAAWVIPYFYRKHEIPAEGLQGSHQSHLLGEEINGSKVGSWGDVQILCSSGCQSQPQHPAQEADWGTGNGSTINIKPFPSSPLPSSQNILHQPLKALIITWHQHCWD